MFECTKIALKETEDDLRKVDYIRNLISLIVFLVHTIYQIVLNFIDKFMLWNLILYGAFTILNLFVIIFTLSVTDFKKLEIKNKSYYKIKKSYKLSKKFFRIYTLIMAISATCNLANKVNAFNLVITALLIVSFILQIVFEVLIKIIQNRVNYIIEALKADIDNTLNPINKVLKLFNLKEDKEETKNQKLLKLKAKEYKKEEKKNKKNKEEKIVKTTRNKDKTSKIKTFFKIKKKKNVDISSLELISDDNK